MKEIILIVLASGLFIFFLWFFIKLNKPQKKVSKEQEKPKENKKDEIPEILKEVTMGNYMFDLSKNDTIDGVELKENETLEKPQEVFLDSRNNIEKAFDEIIDIGGDFDEVVDDEISEIEEYEDDLLDDIEEDFSDNSLLGDVNEGADNKSNKKSIIDEYKGLSKEMKIMVITNILKKKK